MLRFPPTPDEAAAVATAALSLGVQIYLVKRWLWGAIKKFWWLPVIGIAAGDSN